MKDKDKTKEELISELKELRKKHSELKSFFSQDQKLRKAGGTETILVVDDNKYTRTATVEMLKRYGYTLLEAASSQKAIEVLKSHDGTIHLVLSDVVMPETTGPEMVKKLLDLQSELKVIFMSGYAENQIIHDDVFKIIQSDSPFIEKPFTFDEIGLIIRQQLDKKVGQK